MTDSAPNAKKYEFETQPLCIYHGNCIDGWASAMVVYQYYGGEVELLAADYKKPEVGILAAADRKVIIVDFSYKLDDMKNLCGVAASILLIDHHKTAFEELHDWTLSNEFHTLTQTKQIKIHINLNYSGAVLTWQHFYPDYPTPWALKLVEDYDLWKFHLKGTEEFNAALRMVPFDLNSYNLIWSSLLNTNDEGVATTIVNKLLIEGRIVNAYLQIAVVKQVQNAYMAEFEGHKVPICNVSAVDLVSKVGNVLCHQATFAISYYIQGDTVSFSLRSKEFDVSTLAKKYGGGGHKHAAGFSLPLSKAIVIISPTVD